MLESKLLSEYFKLDGQNIYCMVTFDYRRGFPIWQAYVPMYNQRQQDATMVGWRKAIAVYNISTKFLQFWRYLVPQCEL